MARKKKPSSLEYCRCCNKILTEEVYQQHLLDLEYQVANVTLADDLLLPAPPPNPPSPSLVGTQDLLPVHTPPDGGDRSSDADAMFSILAQIDHERDVRQDLVSKVLKGWDENGVRTDSECAFSSLDEGRACLRGQKVWMQDARIRLLGTKLGGDAINGMLLQATVNNLARHITITEERLSRWDQLARERDDMIKEDPTSYDSSRYFNHPLRNEDSKSVVALYLAVVLNVVFHVARLPCTVVLELINLLLALTISNKTVPVDIRTARRQFELDPVTIRYASCPQCHALHPPVKENGVNVYLPTCQGMRWPASKGVCGSKLTKFAIQHGVSVRAPIQPYVMQSFSDFCARLYGRPGIEEMIRRHRDFLKRSSSGDIHDINQGLAIRNFLDTNGKVFVDADHEIRTVWSLSYDGYNPFHNKAAGKSVSVGVLGMACLSLPPSIRTKPENLYLAGLIPGPCQPHLDGLNPFLSPLIDTLQSSYLHGTWFTSTYEHREGRRSREAIIPSINDLPGANKLAGGAGHSAKAFCRKCHLPKDAINNIDLSAPGWAPFTHQEYRDAAHEWLNAQTKAKRKAVYKANGIRWSELLRLEYWDPVKNVVIDGMHTLFLGVVRHHFRVVIGTQWEEREGEREEVAAQDPVPENQLRKARALVESGTASQSQLSKFTIRALSKLCEEYQLQPIQSSSSSKRKRAKKSFVLALLALHVPPPAVEVTHVASQPAQALDAAQPMAVAAHGPSNASELEEGLGQIEIELGEAMPSATVPMLDTAALLKIQDDIRNTLRP